MVAEQPPRENAIGGHADPELLAGGQDLGLDPAREQRVLDLQVADRVGGVGAPDRVSADLLEADVAAVPGGDHLADRPDNPLGTAGL
jgi:hypothetical protein